ncbi:MAG: hypothetical protein ACRDWE_14650 [Acidimicrobiales bacterium]
MGRGVKAFGAFWWDFLVGDTPELFVAMLVLVGIAFALHRDRVAAVILLPALAIVFLLASAWRGRAADARRPPQATEPPRGAPRATAPDEHG